MEEGPSANPSSDVEVELSPIPKVEPVDEVPQEEDDARRTTINPSSSNRAPSFNFSEIDKGSFDIIRRLWP